MERRFLNQKAIQEPLILLCKDMSGFAPGGLAVDTIQEASKGVL